MTAVATPALGRSSLGATQAPLKRAWEVLWALTASSIRSRRDLSLLGLAKWLIEPLLTMAIYYVVMGIILERGLPAFLLFLYCSLVPWRFFSSVVSRSMSVLNNYSSTLTNRVFPKEVLPLTVVFAETLSFVLEAPFFFVLMGIYRIPPTWALLWAPLVIFVTMLVTVGPAYLMSLFGVYFPDYKGVIRNFLRAGYFLAAGLFRLKDVPESLAPYIRLNPMTGMFESFRAVFMEGRPPELFGMLYGAAFGLVCTVIGVVLYRRRQHEFAKEAV